MITKSITYGMSVPSIAESLFATRDDMTEEQKLKEAQKIQDSLMKGFPAIARAIEQAQIKASKLGYTETILGRRRHHPNMMLPRFEFKPMDGYVNPDIDPLDPESLKNKEQIPQRIIDALTKEFNQLKWYGKIVKRTKELEQEKIKVINNNFKIEEAKRQVFNCVDKQTEILTLQGWKKYNEVVVGDKIVSYSTERGLIEEDEILAVYNYDEPAEVVEFDDPNFSACCTLNHKWIVIDNHEVVKTTKQILNSESNVLVDIANNSFESNWQFHDIDFKLAGLVVALGYVDEDRNLVINTDQIRGSDDCIHSRVISFLNEYGIEHDYKIVNRFNNHIYYQISISGDDNKSVLDNIFASLSSINDGFKLVSTLSQHQCQMLIEGACFRLDEHIDNSITCMNSSVATVFQYIAFRAGYQSTLKPQWERAFNIPECSILEVNRKYLAIDMNKVKISKHIAENGVWCVTTNNHAWVARRKGTVYITNNSIVQGSAADLTKMAMLKLENDEEWQTLGGRFQIPVHDELICEVPEENMEKGAEVLARCMCEAGDFLPFKLTCDVETTYRWYGISVKDIKSFDKPESLDYENLSESNIKWLQCMIVENEYLLPVFKNSDGSKPKGIKAQGVNGIVTDELKNAIISYMNRYNLQDDKSFINHIELKVTKGVY